MGAKRRPKKTSRPGAPTSRKRQQGAPSAAEHTEDFLDAFCREIEIQEISFEHWEALHESLDLTVPLFLSSEEAKSGGVRTVRFSRQVQEGESPPCREPAEVTVVIPQGAREGETLLVREAGDRLGDDRGDLRIVLRLRREV